MKAERNHARLYRSSDDVVIAGVCAGVADYLGLPSGKVRLATLLLVLVGGLSIWVYILLWRRTQRSQTARREFPVGRIRDSPETARGKSCVFPICGPDPELKHEIRNSMYKQR